MPFSLLCISFSIIKAIFLFLKAAFFYIYHIAQKIMINNSCVTNDELTSAKPHIIDIL